MFFLRRAYTLLIRIATVSQSAFLLLVRLYWGWRFFADGYAKLFVAGPARIAEQFAEWHVFLPLASAWAVSITECFGGALLLVGLLSRPVAMALAFTMAMALISTPENLRSLKSPFIPPSEFKQTEAAGTTEKDSSEQTAENEKEGDSAAQEKSGSANEDAPDPQEKAFLDDEEEAAEVIGLEEHIAGPKGLESHPHWRQLLFGSHLRLLRSDELLYLMAALIVFLFGPGFFSLDRILQRWFRLPDPNDPLALGNLPPPPP